MEARVTEVDSSRSKLQMELRRQLVDSNVDWIPDWRSQRHLPVGLSQKTYRSYRRRLELFGRGQGWLFTTWQGDCCGRSIPGDVAVRQDVAWDAAESIDYDDIELDADPFAPHQEGP